MAWRKPASVHEWLDILFRHKKKFFFAAIPVAVVVLIASLELPRRYTGEAELEIKKDLVTRLTTNPTMESAVRPLRDLLVQDLLSRSFLDQVFKDLDLGRGLPHHPDGTLTVGGLAAKAQIIDEMRKNIAVRFLARTSEEDRIVVSYSDEDRVRVDRVVTQIAENYVRMAGDRFRGTLTATQRIFARYASEANDALRKSQIDKMDFEQSNPNLDPSDPGSVKNRLVELRTSIQALEDNRQIKRQQLNELKKWVTEAPDYLDVKETVPNPALQVLIERKARAEDELFNVRNQPGVPRDTHPTVVRLNNQIVWLEAEIQAAQGTVVVVTNSQPNLSKINAERDIQVMSGELQALEETHDKLSRQFEVFLVRDRDFVTLRNRALELQRTLTEAQSLFDHWNSRLLQTQRALQTALETSSLSLRVTQYPDPITKPSSPTISTILLAALMLGLGAGALMVLLAELLDGSFRNVQHAVDDLKLPVLGAVNEIRSPAEVFRRKVLGWGVYPAIAGAMLLILLLSIYLANLSLVNPGEFEKLTNAPVTQLTGR